MAASRLAFAAARLAFLVSDAFRFIAAQSSRVGPFGPDGILAVLLLHQHVFVLDEEAAGFITLRLIYVGTLVRVKGVQDDAVGPTAQDTILRVEGR